jgi:hypothetical protein
MNQRDFGLQDRLENLLSLRQCCRQGFFAQDRLTGPKCCNRILGMQRWGQRDVNGINLFGLAGSEQIGRTMLYSEAILPIAKLSRVTTCAQADFMARSADRFDHPMGDSTDSDKRPAHHIADGTKNQRMVSTVQIV